MRKILLPLACAALCLPITANAKNNPFALSLNYNAREQWHYAITYTSQGIFTNKDSSTTKTTTVNSLCTGTKTKPGQLLLKVDSIAVTSDVFSDSVRLKVLNQFKAAEYPFSLIDGYPSIDTAALLPAGSFSEWDLYRQLAKLMPLLPKNPVRAGFKWERVVTVNMRTAAGIVPCEIFSTYKFEKLRNDSAYLSWKFRYAASAKEPSNSTLRSEIPVSGNGICSAVLDLKNSCILSSEMDFTTPVATIGDEKVTWHEHATFHLK
jgi:hypothetical protein